METTWEIELRATCKRNKDDFDSLITTMSPEEMDKVFDSGYGMEEGCPFTAWSKEYVYFPGCYDGAEWVESVPRNPCDIKTFHCGGG